MNALDTVTRVADAVLLEGYLLYPYRATSAKNQYRWTFGVLAPRSWSEAGGCEAWWLEAAFLVAGAPSSLRARLRFLSIVERRVERAVGASFAPVASLEVDGHTFVTWEEGVLQTVEIDAAREGTTPFGVQASSVEETIRDASGAVRGRVVRTQHALRGNVHVRRNALPSPPAEDPLARVSVRVENLSPGAPNDAIRAHAMRWSWASTHVLVAAEGARFVSLFDPPPHAKEAAAACKGTRAWTSLGGAEGKDDVAIASPLILYDHAAIAPESTGDFFDACEIDEILALRTRTLTPEEKALARATDPRAAALLARADAMTDEELERLHGTRRDRLALVPGARVTLCPDAKRRRTDAQDFLYAGCTATIRAIKKDVDGRDFFAVTVDEDPAAEIHEQRGIYRYYTIDEIEPFEGATS